MNESENAAVWNVAVGRIRDGDFLSALEALRPLFDDDQTCEDVLDIICSMQIAGVREPQRVESTA